MTKNSRQGQQALRRLRELQVINKKPISSSKKVDNFRQESEKLAKLETFHPAAFTGSEQVPQKLCDFILALALLYDDIKDSQYALLLLQQAYPKSSREKTAINGNYFGTQIHLIRYQVGLVYALCELIQDHKELLNLPDFQSLVKQLPPKSREAWQVTVDVALEHFNNGPLAKALKKIRHKVAFHYDSEQIMMGFKKHFFDGLEIRERAYISRGADMQGTRFYFADAAAQGYLESQTADPDTKILPSLTLDTLRHINLALLALVSQFIQSRGENFQRV